MTAIEFEDVSFQYLTGDRIAVEDVSFSLAEGELCALIGANGSGKTTICNIARGFAPKFYSGTLVGKVKVFGEDISHLSLGDLATRVGFVFQNPFVQITGSTDTVFEEIAFGLENLGVEREEIRRRVLSTIDLLDIGHLRDKQPMSLSGGQKQRVALASILAMDPPVFVIDEPTSQLDPAGTEEVFNIIKILKDMGKSILLVEHKIDLIARYADHVIAMSDGHIIADSTPRSVLTDMSLINRGVTLPSYVEIGERMKRAGAASPLPITQEEAITMITDVRVP